MKTPRNIAHRGASGYCPENTMVAFRKGIELGANGFETDVQMTQDGELILMHDFTIDRTTTGAGYVRDLTLQDIKQYDAGSWFGESFSGEKVPTLDDLFELIVGTDILLNIELKNTLVPYEGMEQKVIDCILKYNMLDNVIISTFNHKSLVRCKEINEKVQTGVLYFDFLYESWKYSKGIRADVLHPWFRTIEDNLVQHANDYGLKVNTWTVDDQDDMTRFIRLGVDGIITNYPDRLSELLEQADKNDDATLGGVKQ